MKKTERQKEKSGITVLGYTRQDVGKLETAFFAYPLQIVGSDFTQEQWEKWFYSAEADTVVLVDIDRVPLTAVSHLIQVYGKNVSAGRIGYIGLIQERLWGGMFERTWAGTTKAITQTPFLIGPKDFFRKAYVGCDLGNPLTATAYSLQKSNVKFQKITTSQVFRTVGDVVRTKGLNWRYSVDIPMRYLTGGGFFKDLFSRRGIVRKEMIYRLCMLVFALFCYFYMPVVSRHYGISADEFIDNRQAEYVLDYFAKGDKAALNQPKTLLHYYGSGIQVVVTAIADFFRVEDIYGFRHWACSLVGAWGIWIIGLLGLRFGGGVCGILSMLMLFFTPRFFGHAMNNLKDVPFAVGYLAAIYYFIRLFDTYPSFKPRYMVGAVIGIFLAFGSRAGGLILYPYLVMYGGLFYILKVGWREFYKFGRYKRDFFSVLTPIVVVLLAGYLVSIVLWPFALQHPVENVLLSLEQLTNIGSGIRTMFDGQQMMSNMLPVTYAPKYLSIGMPLVALIGFGGYLVYSLIWRKEFTLISFFLLFSAVFPVFWVMYKNSNLYGGIRHMLFVMPIVVVLAGKFWSLMLTRLNLYGGVAVFAVWIGLTALPARHMIANSPNDYVYFNELVGGLKGAYGDYDTDYFFNSLKNSCDWFKKNVVIPKGKKTIVVTNHSASVSEYFKADTNIKVIYSRYYEKHAKDWDYAVWGNMYIDRFQVKNGLFPPPGTIYASLVDGYPMSVVVKRQYPEETEGFRLEKEGRPTEALKAFRQAIQQQPQNEEMWAKMAKVSFILQDPVKAEEYARNALKYQPHLNEALYMLALSALQQRKYEESLKAAQEMLEQNAYSVDAYYLKASVYKEKGNYKEAIEQLNKALRYRPNFDRALLLAGEILVINRNYKAALEIYHRLLKNNNSVQVAAALADCYCRVQNYGEVEKLLLAIEKIQPGYFPAYQVKVRMAIQRGQYEKAAALLQQTAGKGDDADLYVLRALYYRGMGQVEKKKEMAEVALRLQPNHPEAKELIK